MGLDDEINYYLKGLERNIKISKIDEYYRWDIHII